MRQSIGALGRGDFYESRGVILLSKWVHRQISFSLFITLIMICEVEIHLIMGFYGWLSSLTCDYVVAKIIHSSSVFSGPRKTWTFLYWDTTDASFLFLYKFAMGDDQPVEPEVQLLGDPVSPLLRFPVSHTVRLREGWKDLGRITVSCQTRFFLETSI